MVAISVWCLTVPLLKSRRMNKRKSGYTIFESWRREQPYPNLQSLLKEKKFSKGRRLWSAKSDGALTTMPVDTRFWPIWKAVVEREYFLVVELVSSKFTMWTINSINSNKEGLMKSYNWHLLSGLWKPQSSASLGREKLNNDFSKSRTGT